MAVVPNSYEDWKHCITVACGISLTPGYVNERVAALSNKSDHHTQRFIEQWGQAHHQRTLAWFRQAAAELVS